MARGKRCTGCAEAKPLEEFYRYPGKPSRRPKCKECMRAQGRAWRALHPDYDAMRYWAGREAN